MTKLFLQKISGTTQKNTTCQQRQGWLKKTCQKQRKPNFVSTPFFILIDIKILIERKRLLLEKSKIVV